MLVSERPERIEPVSVVWSVPVAARDSGLKGDWWLTVEAKGEKAVAEAMPGANVPDGDCASGAAALSLDGGTAEAWGGGVGAISRESSLTS